MKLLLSALEPSSNIHAQEVIKEIIRKIIKESINSLPKEKNTQDKQQKTLQNSLPINLPKIQITKIQIMGIFDKNLEQQILQELSQEFKQEQTTQNLESMQIASPQNTIANDFINDFISNHLAFTPLFFSQDFSIMGFVDVAKKLPFILKAQKTMLHTAKEADKILFLDSSSFHIPLAKKIKSSGIKSPIYYYILPQVWAWKPWRTKKLEAFFDKLLAILPFELSYYSLEARQGKKIEFVGHPLLDELDFTILESRQSRQAQSAQGKNSHTQNLQDKSPQDKSPQNQNLRNSTKNIAKHIVFMPGSRRGEIARIFPTFIEVAHLLEQKNICTKTLVIPTFFASKSQKELESIYGDLSGFELSFDTQKSLKEADFAFICSGTATLEAALLGTPFVLCYKAATLDYLIAMAFVGLRYIGLANIFYNALCGESAGRGESKMHEELIQGDMSVDNLLSVYNSELERAKNGHFIKCAKELWEYLSTQNTKDKNHKNDDKIPRKKYYGSAQNVANMLLMD